VKASYFLSASEHRQPLRPSLSIWLWPVMLAFVLFVSRPATADTTPELDENPTQPKQSDLLLLTPPAITPGLAGDAPKSTWQPRRFPPTPAGGTAFLQDFREPPHYFDILGHSSSDNTGVNSPLEIPQIDHARQTVDHRSATNLPYESTEGTPQNDVPSFDAEPHTPPSAPAPLLEEPDDRESTLLINILQFGAVILACLALPLVYKAVQRQLSAS